MKTSLIVGGSSGLGLELAKRLAEENDVLITGRTNPDIDKLKFIYFDLTQPNLPTKVTELVAELPKIYSLVYAAGFFQEGRITDLTNKQIEEMLDVGGRGLIYFVREILNKQGNLAELVTITSTSQWIPRQKEPIYNFVKAGAGHLSNGLAEDGRIKKVLVAGPAGMQTPFWEGVNHPEFDQMLDPKWVAEQVLNQLTGKFKYKYAHVLRGPARVEVIEIR